MAAERFPKSLIKWRGGGGVSFNSHNFSVLRSREWVQFQIGKYFYISRISILIVPFERSLSKLSENHNIFTLNSDPLNSSHAERVLPLYHTLSVAPL